MRVQDLKNYVQSLFSHKFIMNQFHEKSPANSVVVLLGSAGLSTRNTGTLQFQFLVRNTDPEVAEQIAYELHSHFNNKTDYEINGNKVVMSRGQQAVPLYTGTDENTRFIYSVNIEAIIDNQ